MIKIRIVVWYSVGADCEMHDSISHRFVHLCGVIAHFVTNFVPIATRVCLEKIPLAAFGGASTNPPL